MVTKAKSKAASRRALANSADVRAAPLSIGTSLTAVPPIVSTRNNGTSIIGREFLGNCYEYNSSNFQLGALVPIHPAYYIGSVQANMCRTFEQYRYRQVMIHFITRQPTTVTGQTALCVTREVLEPCENGSNAAFLARVMSRGNCTIGPTWRNHSIVVECDDTWRNVDAFVGSDYDDNVLAEFQAYTLSGISDVAGYIVMDYEVEFRKTMYQPHSSSLPLTTGTGTLYTCTDTSATPTANNSVQLANTTLTGQPNGTIFRFVLSIDQSTVSTGTTAANAWYVGTSTFTNTTTVANALSNFTLSNGQAIYLVVVGTSLYAYASYEQACSGDASGTLFYRTTGGTSGSFVGIAYQLRFGNAIVMFAQ